jgi:hypothetical protein
MRPNPTIQRQLAQQEITDRNAWYEETQKAAAELAERLRQQHEQVMQEKLRLQLETATGLPLAQLTAIRDWIRANP